MHALVFDRSKDQWASSKGFRRINAPTPTIGAKRSDRDSVVVKVQYAGVCGTDRGIWNRQVFRDQILGSLQTDKKPYRIIGHEMFGEIVELGPDAKRFKLKVGDKVSAESHLFCGTCYQCKRGQEHVCTNERILGISHDGCFAQFVKVPARILWKTDTAKIRPEVAVLQEPFGNAVHVAAQAPLKGATVAIFGLGPIGMFDVLIARGLGAKKIIGVDPNPAARAMAKKLGIDAVIDVARPVAGAPAHVHDRAVTERILEITKGIGADVALEMSGYNSSLNTAIHCTRRGGTVVLFGVKNGDMVIGDYNALILRGLSMHAVIGRKVWNTWKTTQVLLESRRNGIADKIYDVMLQRGKGSILPLAEYENDAFAEKLKQYPKLLFRV